MGVGVNCLLAWRIYGGIYAIDGGGVLVALAISGGIYSVRGGGGGRGIIWRGRFTGVNRGAGARFLRMSTKALDKFYVLVYYRGSLNDSSVNIEKHIRRIQGAFFYNRILR